MVLHLISVLIFILILMIMLFNPDATTTTKKEDFCTAEQNLKAECSQEIPIPILKASCNNVPVFPKGLEPKEEGNELPLLNKFCPLIPEYGKYRFIIPELKYDGIYSRKILGGKCCWSLFGNRPNTYGANKFFHIPKKKLLGKTAIQPPECSWAWYSHQKPLIIKSQN